MIVNFTRINYFAEKLYMIYWKLSIRHTSNCMNVHEGNGMVRWLSHHYAASVGIRIIALQVAYFEICLKIDTYIGTGERMSGKEY